MTVLTQDQYKEVESLLLPVELDYYTRKLEECSDTCSVIVDVVMDYDECDDVHGDGRRCTTIDNIELCSVSGFIEFDDPDYHLVVKFSELCPEQFGSLMEVLIK